MWHLLSLNHWTLTGREESFEWRREVTELPFQLLPPLHLKVEITTIHTADHILVNTLVHMVTGMLPNSDEWHCKKHPQFSPWPIPFPSSRHHHPYFIIDASRMTSVYISSSQRLLCSWFFFSPSSLYINIHQKLLAQICPFLSHAPFSKHANFGFPHHLSRSPVLGTTERG